MANLPTAYLNATEVTAREAEVPAADFGSGMNFGASNAPGIGIATDVAPLTEGDEGWTLLDQDGAARDPQVSQPIGGDTMTGTAGKGTVGILASATDADGEGGLAATTTAKLLVLADGWIATA